MSINKVMLTGNLTRDPELKHTNSFTAILKFGIAVNERVKQGDQYTDRPSFIDCTMFGSRAESVSRFISKGSKVAIEGRLRWSQWEAKDGSKRSKLEVVVDNIEFMSKGNNSQQQTNNQDQVVYDEDIPF